MDFSAASRSDRISIYFAGVVAAIGAAGGGALGYWIASLIFTPSERAGTSLLIWFFENGLALLALLIPLIGGGALIGWVALPAVVGAVLGWRRAGLAAAYQIAIGAGSALLSFGLLGAIAKLPDGTTNVVAWALFGLVTLGAPTLSRLLVRER